MTNRGERRVLARCFDFRSLVRNKKKQGTYVPRSPSLLLVIRCLVQPVGYCLQYSYRAIVVAVATL
jgi:hypothetical protein